MKITRRAGLVALLASGALVLAACGSDNNTTPTTTAAGGTTAASVSAAAESGTTFEGAGFTCATGALRSSGSTAQGKVMEQWIADFNAKCGANINAYGGGGSGKGIQDFIANQVDFAGSDSAMTADQASQARSQRCANNAAFNLPMVTGPIALAYNLPDVQTLILTPEVTAGIFAGTITTWNAPEIAAINPGVTTTKRVRSIRRSRRDERPSRRERSGRPTPVLRRQKSFRGELFKCGLAMDAIHWRSCAYISSRSRLEAGRKSAISISSGPAAACEWSAAVCSGRVEQCPLL